MRWCVLGLAMMGCASPFADCAGALTGTFDGAGDGTVSAQLTDDGELTISLVDSDGEALTSAVVPVGEDGTITTADGQEVQINGTLDLEACTGSGDWATIDGSGGWEIAQ